MTIPAKVRQKYEIREGDLLTIETTDEDRKIVMRVKNLPEPGRPGGLEVQKKILKDLEKFRKNWR